MAVTVENLKTLFPLSVADSQITPHLNRAAWDYEEEDFGEDTLRELEVVGSKALYYLAPLLWVDMQNRADEYEESLETFRDIEKFKKHWLDRAESAATKKKTESEDEVSWEEI